MNHLMSGRGNVHLGSVRLGSVRRGSVHKGWVRIPIISSQKYRYKFEVLEEGVAN